MEKRSVYSILAKKSLKDLVSNIKQFISIIFIIALAVTLFVGLQANYISLDTRVDDFYTQGNVASYFMTYTMVDDNEEKAINDLMPFDVDTNKRLNISAKLEGKSLNIAVSDSYPTVSKAYELFKDGTDNDHLYEYDGIIPKDEQDFFILDQSMFTFLNEDPSREKFEDKYKIGDEIELGLSISSYKSTILNNFDGLFSSFKDTMSEEEFSKVSEIVKNFIENYFEENPSISIKTKYTNYMLHPENIAADNTTTSISLMGRKTLLNCLNPIINEAINSLRNELIDGGAEQAEAITYYLNKFGLSFLNSSNQLLLRVENDRYMNDAKRLLDNYFASKSYEEDEILNRMIYMTDLNNLPSNLTVANDIEQAYDLSITFPMIFLLVAVLIVITTISQLIIKERQQIGTFKALGLTKVEILTHYLMTTLSISLVGIIFGIFFGPWLLPKIMDIKYNIIYSITVTEYAIPWLVALLTGIVILTVVGFITWYIVNKELKGSPVETMRPAVPKIKFKGKNAAKPKQTRFMSLKVALRNIKVYFTKSIMVVIGICGCTGLLVCGFGVDNTLDYGIKHDMTTFFNYDIMTTYSNYSENNNDIILNDPQFIDLFEEEKCYGLTVLPTTYYINEGTSFSNTSYIVPEEAFNDGTFKIEFPTNTVAISKSNADNLGIKVGEVISFKILNTEFKRTVGLIYDDFFMKSIFIHAEDNVDGNVIADMNAKYITSSYLNLKGNPTEEEIEEIINQIKQLDIGVATCISLEQSKTKVEDIVSSVKLMTMAIKVFAILLAVVCLINLALLNFKERTREIATMKVLGFSLPEIARSLIYEVLILTVVGSCLGLCIGFPLLYLILSINQNNYVSFLYYIAPGSYILGVVLAVITSLAVNILLSFFINKVPMVESLKSVE